MIEYKDSKRIITYPSVDAYWDFDGSDYVDLGNAILSGTGAFSSMAVIKVDSAGSGSRDIWSNYRSSATGGNQLYVLSTNKVSYYQGSGNTSHTAGTALTDDTWYNVIIVNDGSTSTIYINGTSDGATSQSASVSGSNMQIGGLDSSGTFDGGIADVAFWSRALTTAEITALQSDPNPSNLSSTSNLISYYNFEQTSGNLIDQVGSNNGTNNGATQTGTRNVAQAKPTDVQDNSILVEKDTANRYWFDADPTATTTKTYDHSGDSVVSVRSVSNSTNWWEAPRQGILIEAGHAAVGTYVKKISLPLLKSGTPTGNYTFAIRDSSETIKGSATGVANNLTTSYVITEVTLNTAVLIEVGDHVTIEYDNTAPATGKLSFPTSTSGWVANTDQQNWISSAWQGDGDGAGAGRKWQFTFDSTPASITLPATWTKDGASFNETFTGTQDASWSSSGSRISIDTVNKRLKFDDVNDNTTDYLSKIFPEGALSDTMWTMLGQETFINSSSNLAAGVAQACYGAGSSNLNIADNTNLSAIVAFIGGCGTNKTHRAMAHYYGANGTSQSACYSGSFSTEYWDTLWRESATTMRYKVFSDGRSRATNVLDAPVTITNTLTGLDRFLAVGGNHGVTTRHTYGYVNAIEFWDGVNK